jgi:NAD-dependent SIR2 family protein deacetylase
MENYFRLQCKHCQWTELSTGLSSDLTHLAEIKKCPTCGGPRVFRCPKCGTQVKMLRIRGSSPSQTQK